MRGDYFKGITGDGDLMLNNFFRNKRKEKNIRIENIDINNIPGHVAIIMDGNGRWAKNRGLPRVAGHRAGIKAIKEVTRIADKIDIKILTLYAFSTENWKRPKNEVKFLMNLPQEFLIKDIDELIERNVQIKVIGFNEKVPAHTLKAIREAEEKTKNNTGLILNFALNYGSRDEIINATKAIANDVLLGKLGENSINEEIISQYLLTKDYPDPDLLIRTGGEQRISNFLLWQLAYAELWFTPVYWPEFNQNDFLRAIYDYQKRSRRFGAL